MTGATPRVLALAELWLGRVAAMFAAVGGLAAFGLMAVTVTAVFARYILNDPIFGIEDLSQMGLTVVVAAAVAYGAGQGAHVSVDVIRMVAGRRITRVTDAVARGLGVAIVAVAAYALFQKGACGMPCGAITGNLSIVHTPFYYTLGLAMALYAALLVVQLAVGLCHWSGADPNEAHD